MHSQKRREKVSLSGMYLKESHRWKRTVLRGESGEKDERLLLKVTLGPGFLCLCLDSPVAPRLNARLSSSHFCLLWLAKLSLRGKSKPFLPPAGVRLNTEMATGKRQGGKTKKESACLLSGLADWPTERLAGSLTGLGWGMLEQSYQVGDRNCQLVSKTPKHAAAGFLMTRQSVSGLI